MMVGFFNELVHFFITLNMRKIVLMLFLILTSIRFISQKKRNKSNGIIEDLSHYEMDENGRYPWEVDTDDSPKRISQEAKRYVNQHGPKRGRW